MDRMWIYNDWALNVTEAGAGRSGYGTRLRMPYDANATSRVFFASRIPKFSGLSLIEESAVYLDARAKNRTRA